MNAYYIILPRSEIMRFAKVILDQNEKKFEQKVSDEIKVMQEVGLMLSDFEYPTIAKLEYNEPSFFPSSNKILLMVFPEKPDSFKAIIFSLIFNSFQLSFPNRRKNSP